MVGPTLQIGKLRQGFSGAPPGGSTGPEKWSYAATTTIVGTDTKWLEGPAAGRGLWRPWLVTPRPARGVTRRCSCPPPPRSHGPRHPA